MVAVTWLLAKSFKYSVRVLVAMALNFSALCAAFSAFITEMEVINLHLNKGQHGVFKHRIEYQDIFENKGNAKHGISPRLYIRPCDLDLWPWTSIGFQILLRSKYVPSLVKIHWRMLILECSQGCYTVKIWPGDIDLWPMTLKINMVPDSHKDYVCTKFGQNPLKDVDSRVFTRMLCGKNMI